MQGRCRGKARRLSHAVAVLVVGLAVVSSPARSDDFGPVPPIEVKPALAELGKRLFFDKRLSGRSLTYVKPVV